MTSYFLLNISKDDMVNLFDNTDLDIREYRKECDVFFISLRHNKKDNAKNLVKSKLDNLNIKSAVDDYQIPEPFPRCW